MISWNELINHLQKRRIEWAVEAAKSPTQGDPKVAYGLILGRDQAIEMLLQDITEMISTEEEDTDA